MVQVFYDEEMEMVQQEMVEEQAMALVQEQEMVQEMEMVQLPHTTSHCKTLHNFPETQHKNCSLTTLCKCCTHLSNQSHTYSLQKAKVVVGSEAKEMALVGKGMALGCYIFGVLAP